LSTTPQTVYVQLLNEGTEVWRPAPAIALTADVFELLRPEGYGETEEEWQFLPGTRVYCELRGNDLYAVAQADVRFPAER
jgi:hypothetical protein